jgi:hypothetical protein
MAWLVAEATSILGLIAADDLSRDMSLHVDGAWLQGDFSELGTAVRAVLGQLRTVSSGVWAVRPASRVCRERGRTSSTTSTCSPGT